MQTYFEEDTKLEDIFNPTAMNCLPGTFYVYQVTEDDVLLKMCNLFHQEIFGYTYEECLDKHPAFYLTSDYTKIIEHAIETIKETGVAKQVYANILTKAGKSIPFVFEGYKFQIGNDNYFAGMGLDITDLISVKEQLTLLGLEKEKITNTVLKKEKELLALTLSENQNNDILKGVSTKLEKIVKHNEGQALETEILQFSKTLSNQIKVKDNWNDFKELFINIHKDFFKNLKTLHPDLSPTEIRFCAYLKINMSAVNLCNVMNISKDGLKKKRYRLRHKLQLERPENLNTYIRNI